jgi:hypothetical protein
MLNPTPEDRARQRALELADYDETIFIRWNDAIRHERFSQADVITALDQSAGIASLAARRLNCSRRTITNYVSRYPVVRAALKEIRDELVDLASMKILELIKEKNPRVVTWYATRYGAARGYGRRDLSEAKPKPTAPSIPWSELNLSPEDLRAIQAAFATR